MKDDHDRLLTIAQAADRLAVSPDTIRRWIAAGMLAAFRHGRIVRVPESTVGAFLARSTTPAKPPPSPRARRLRKARQAPAGSDAALDPRQRVRMIRAQRAG